MSLTSYRAAPPRGDGFLRGPRDRVRGRCWPDGAVRASLPTVISPTGGREFAGGPAMIGVIWIGVGVEAWRAWRRPALPRLETQYHRR